MARRFGERLRGKAVGKVAGLDPAGGARVRKLCGQRLQPLGSPGDQPKVVAVSGQKTGVGLADA
jgi:hypothetical protein